MSSPWNIDQLDRRAFMAALAAVGAGSLLPASAEAQGADFKGRQLLSSGFGGSTMDIIQKAAFDPFDAATGAKSTQVPMQSAAALARMKAEAGNPQIDMYQFSGGQEAQAKSEGLTEPMKSVPNLANVPGGLKDPDGHWVTWAVIAEGIVYNKDKIPTPPTSYKDFFKPEYKGHIAFPAITNGFGMDFLVMLARTFGGGEDNIEPGFAALAKLKNETIFKAASDLPGLFGQGDIWIIPYDTGNAFKTAQSGLPVAFATPQEGSPAVPITSCIAKGAKNADVANGAINYLLKPEAQIAIAQGMRWSASNVNTKLPAELASEIPAVSQLAQLDRAKINANRAAWTERWNREIAR
ncbi:extracellular solute-binding protein [Chelatococcus asaccharovorans]|uniref:Putative spermidine/putrescine transport system substrate-binding protein n=1 Tax=Chelatococcus asaccharovorans TaxID=28210 RepID=A0A2V3U2G8_9HYPH|nr:extracellular solute-binding protein [Chelatococcus asaccharovorans]MBS7702187.1 extracellular solute-binding protein [Chelatococcus asaccharovorans]PXW56615.1 putative spermidine/putrescine transport system substrate-binding protein [Chelatococcus asaccharovorans]